MFLSSIAFDANGNTVTDASGKSYTWDFENRLVSTVVPGTGTVIFKYDPFGRRIQKSSSLGTTNFLYDGMKMPRTSVWQLGITGFAACIFVFSYSCVAEGAFRVHGKLTVDGLPPYSDCEIKVISAGSESVVKTMTVGAEFEKSVVVAPGSHHYYFEIGCPGTQALKTSTYTVTGAKQYKTPIELNTLSLTTTAK